MGSLNGHTMADCSLSPAAVKDVAVIGAGISGVVSAAHLLKEGFNVTVFERTNVIGGVWHFDPRLDREPPFPNVRPPKPDWTEAEAEGVTGEEASLIHAPPGPCYAGLLSNIPSIVMRSSLLHWPQGTGDFVEQAGVRQYIEDIARHHNVAENILFNTRVESVSKPEEEHTWTVKTARLDLDHNSHSVIRKSWAFDAVVVASGHYHIPFVPDVPGLAQWKRRFPDRVMHSKHYRTPTPFAGKTVLSIGAGTSSLDIAREVEKLGAKVYQSRRQSKLDITGPRTPKTVERVAMVAEFIADEEPADNDHHSTRDSSGAIPGKVRLVDGRLLEDIDHVVVATGYITSYPFLNELEQPYVDWEDADDKVVVTSDGYITHNLHKDIFYIPDPTLAFIGTSHLVSTFSLFDFQARVAAKVFSGKARLPSESTMKEEHRQRKARFDPADKFHSLYRREKGYINELLDWVNGDLTEAGLGPMEGMDEEWHEAYDALMARAGAWKPVAAAVLGNDTSI